MKFNLSVAALAACSFVAIAPVQANLDQKIATYEKSSKIATTIKTLRRNAFAKSRGLCAKHVRLGYMASGLIPSHPGIPYANGYKAYFDKNNWTNLANPKTSKKWSDLIRANLFKTPHGCTVVYEGIVPANDRNGHIGHIETRLRKGKTSTWGFISDYYSPNPRSGLNCIKKGKKVRRARVFTSRKTKKRVTRYIDVTSCHKHDSTGAFVSDEWRNRRVIGVHCKL